MDRPASSIQVVDRLARLLDAIATNDGPVSLKVLSAETGLHPSTAFRILSSLVAHGLVERTGNGQYQLGVKLLHLASRVHEKLDMRLEAKPIMEWLRTQVGETVNLVVREGDEVVYIERATSSRIMRVEQVIGSRAPLHVTAVGKLFLAEGGADACLEYASRTGLPAYTANTFTDPAALWRNVKTALRNGHALDDEEAEPGVGCIAVPVRDASGALAAALSISAPIERRKEKEWVPLLKQAGEQLSARLGYQPKA